MNQTFALSIREDEAAATLDLLSRTAKALGTCVVDDVHLANRFGACLDKLVAHSKRNKKGNAYSSEIITDSSLQPSPSDRGTLTPQQTSKEKGNNNLAVSNTTTSTWFSDIVEDLNPVSLGWTADQNTTHLNLLPDISSWNGDQFTWHTDQDIYELLSSFDFLN